MPYRRLPNTDTARIKALRTAVEKAGRTDYGDLPISIKLLASAKKVLPEFETLIGRYKQAYRIQVKANRSLQQKAKNCRMYVSHFIQVLYMSVIREEIKENQLMLYGLEKENLIVPDLTSNEQLMLLGQNIIAGEKLRVARGGVSIYNPSIAKVKALYSIFSDGYNMQKRHQKATSDAMAEVVAYREVVDATIFEIWEGVERSNRDLSPERRLKKNREYGVIYYYRKGERVI